MQNVRLFEKNMLGKLEFKNRLIVAPMTRVSGTESGNVGDLMQAYYCAFAEGGFGAVITEGVYTDKVFSQGYKYQPGLTDADQMGSWATLISKIQQAGARVIVQLMHAGALSQHNRFHSETRGPSAIQPVGQKMEIYRGSGLYAMPSAFSAAEIDAVITGFMDAALRAQDAGADGVEVHGANGYLLDQFLTDYTNDRQDSYGGTVQNRVRLTAETIARVREATGPDFIVGVRTSQAKVNDFDHKWSGARDDAKVVFRELAKAGASYIHTTEHHADQPAFEIGPSLAQLARDISGLPVIANGGLSNPAKAVAMLEGKQADFISLGKAALASPDWPNRVQKGQNFGKFDADMFQPLVNLESANNYFAKRA